MISSLLASVICLTIRTWFPVDERLPVVAQWIPYNPPKLIAVPNILGETEQEPCPGVAVFRLNGAEYRLEPVLDDGRLFFIFNDRTVGEQTYPGGGSFLPMPEPTVRSPWTLITPATGRTSFPWQSRRANSPIITNRCRRIA